MMNAWGQGWALVGLKMDVLNVDTAGDGRRVRPFFFVHTTLLLQHRMDREGVVCRQGTTRHSKLGQAGRVDSGEC